MASSSDITSSALPDEQTPPDAVSCGAVRSSFLPQNGGSSLEIADIWPNVAHEDFDKSNEEAGARTYSIVRDNRSIQEVANPGPALLAGGSDAVDPHTSCQESCAVNVDDNESNAGVKRARRDEQIKESLSQMVKTWRESLEVLKDSEAKRVETLQRLSSTMTGLLEILKK